MKKLTFFLVIFISSASFAQDTQRLLNNLCGKWSGQMGNMYFAEEWSCNKDNNLHGKGYFIANNDTIEQETLQIKKSGKKYLYIAQPGIQEPTPFQLQKSAKNVLYFKNIAHDFPQEIIYDFKSNKELQITLKGSENGESKNIEFLLNKEN